MANKRISELSSRTPSATDLMLVGDPTTGYSYKCLVSQVGGVTSVFGRTGAVTAQEGDYSLTSLSDVTITSPASGDILTYNGSSWVNSAGGFVPYTGATANVSLGEYGILAGWYRLDTTPTGTPTDQGTMYWDDNQKTLALIMNGTTQKVGHDQFYYAKNSTGTTIPKGTAVRFAGTDGSSGHLLITPFLADGSNPSSYFMGVTAEAITNGSFGKVQSFGRLDGVDTSAFAEGDILYASTTVAGGFQTTVPVAPNNIVQVAAVVSDAVNGKLLIRPTLGSKLTSDESVKLTSVANGNVLQYNSTLSVWENVAPSSLAVSNIYTADGTLTGNRTVTMGAFSLSLAANRNSDALLTVQNVGTGAGASGGFYAQNSNGISGGVVFAKAGTGYGSVLTINSNDGYIYNNGGNFVIVSSGQIRFTPGNLNAPGMSIFTTNNIGINTTTDAGFRLDVNGTMRVQGMLTATSNLTISGVVAPSTSSAFRYLYLGTHVAWMARESGSHEFYLMNNAYFDGAFKYRTSEAATSYNSIGGVHSWSTAAAGTANASLTFTERMRITNDGIVGIGTTSPSASAILDITSTTRGVLLPRMTTTQRNAISSPATGLIVYDTTNNNLDYYNGTQWLDVLASDFITIDNTNNRLGINTASPTYDLHVTGTGAVTGSLDLATAGSTRVTIGNQSDTSYKLSVDGDLRVYGNIRTAQPTGGTGVGVWRLGSTATGTFTLDTTTCVEIEIGGSLVKLATVS